MEGTKFKRSSRSIRARWRALGSIAPVVDLVCSSSDEGEVSLARRESCADFRKYRSNFLDPSEWTLAAYGLFLEENITILEARSILYAVRYAKSLLIPPNNLAQVLTICKGRSTILTLLSVMRRIFASGFREGFVLSFSLIPSELNYSDKGSRFFDREYDPSKSLLHVLAQRLRSSPSPTCDQDCYSPSLMDLDVGKVGLTSHIHVPITGAQTCAQSDDLSFCAGHAAAISSPSSCVVGLWESSVSCPNKPADVVDLNFWMSLRFGGRHLGEVQNLATYKIR